MRKFRFHLEAVLNVRKSRENEALIALGGAQRAYQLEVMRKHELQLLLQAALGRREALGSRDFEPVLSFQIEQAFINGTKQRLIQADQAIMRASRSVEKSLRAYLHARRQTRMIESLQEKAYAEFRRELAKRERKELDELVVLRARFTEQAPRSVSPASEESA